ncbi:MAG: hypothetical protein KME17_29225 [Cyanosarcina radialis HA8281-LM2]|jgi:hypothetical protein|nr:hypothetical protein [Cyanosarcina radialis HA8281-LM2]
MKTNLRNSLLLSAFTICGIAAGASSVMAAPVESTAIPFNGTVTSICAFGSPNGGTLGDISAPTDDFIASDVGTGATSGSITLSCNGNASLRISNFTVVSQPSGMTIAPNSFVVFANAQGKSLSYRINGVANSQTLTNPMNENVNVNVNLQFTSPVKPGNYSYSTKLTATPL